MLPLLSKRECKHCVLCHRCPETFRTRPAVTDAALVARPSSHRRTRDRRTGAHPKLDLARAGRAAGADKELLTRWLLQCVRELRNAPAMKKKELQKGREERRAAQEMPASVSSIHTTRIVAG